MTEAIAASLIGAGALLGMVFVICVATLKAIEMKLAHIERVRDRDEDDEIDRRLTAVEAIAQQDHQEIKAVRSSLTLKGLR